MKKVEIKPGVYWVGGVDWDIRNFHGCDDPLRRCDAGSVGH